MSNSGATNTDFKIGDWVKYVGGSDEATTPRLMGKYLQVTGYEPPWSVHTVTKEGINERGILKVNIRPAKAEQIKQYYELSFKQVER